MSVSAEGRRCGRVYRWIARYCPDRKLSGKEKALLVATACSSPPKGRARWTLELLADEMVRLTEHDNISRETVRRRLEEDELKPWRKDMWCIPQVDGESVTRMEDVLSNALAQLAIIPVLDAHQNERTYHLTGSETVAALARIFQPVMKVAPHSLKYLTILIKQITKGLQRRIQLHALKRQLEIGKGHLPRRRPCDGFTRS